MTLNLSGPGVGLQPSQNLYPSYLGNAPLDAPTNIITLAPGDELPLQAGTFLVSLGKVLTLEYLDPTTGIWRLDNEGCAYEGGFTVVTSDGFTRRIANRTGCPIGALVANGGAGYVQSTATITASSGGSTWQPVVGGSLSVTTVNVTGANYKVQPIVFIPAPPNPGVQASAVANISAGTVSGVTLTNVGAGYLTAPVGSIQPNPTDPNFGTITQAQVTFALVGAGQITAALCTNSGAPVTSAPTLTVAGGGATTATVTAILLQTVTGVSVVSAGTGFGTATLITSVGGVPAAGFQTNPEIEFTNFRPRPVQIAPTITGGTIAAVGTIYDGGLFAVGTGPAAIIQSGGGLPTTAASVTLTLGSANDRAIIQQL